MIKKIISIIVTCMLVGGLLTGTALADEANVDTAAEEMQEISEEL